MPTDFTAILGKGLLVVPGVLVAAEELVLDFVTDVEDRHREDGNKNVGVLGGTKHLLGERNLGQGDGLRSSGIDPEVLDRFLDTEEVPAHDLAGAVLRG